MKLDLSYKVRQRRVRDLEQTYIKNEYFHNILLQQSIRDKIDCRTLTLKSIPISTQTVGQ